MRGYRRLRPGAPCVIASERFEAEPAGIAARAYTTLSLPPAERHFPALRQPYAVKTNPRPEMAGDITKGCDVGLFGKLFGSKSVSRAQRPLTGPEADRIIKDYGAALQSPRDVISDASKLPHPKARIKQALILGMRSTSNPKIKAESGISDARRVAGLHCKRPISPYRDRSRLES